MRKIVPALLTLFICISGYSQFTPGNLALLQAEASASNTTCNVIEINSTATNQAAITTTVINGTGTNALRFSGSATSTGYLANSNDGSLLCFTGANNTSTSANVNTLNPRGIGTLNAAQSFNLPTSYTGVSSNQTRGATSIDNSNWFIGDQGGLYTNGTTSANPSGNLRSIKPFGSTVYVSSASSTATVIQVSTVATASAGPITGLPGLTNNANLQDFYLISSGTNGTSYDVLYILSATSNTVGNISKFSLVSGSWTANGTYTTSFGGFGMAAQQGGGGAFLYVSSGQGALTANSIVKLNDASGFNSTIAITTANNVILYTAPALKIIKGVAFAPVASSAASVVPSQASISFANTAVGAFSAGQTITFTASGLIPASGNLTATAPNSNFQVSADGISWANTASIAYSGGGTTIGNLQIRFSPQASGLQSGSISISGGGLATAATVGVSGTGTNGLSLTFSPSTTAALNPPYVSGVINDAADPAKQQGILIDVKENNVNIAAANYVLAASSNNTSVAPNANINITKADGLATIKITGAAAGYADITLTLTSNGNNTTLVIHYAVSVSASTAATTHWHTSFGDASGAVALDDNYMIVCNDENNLLYVYHRDQSGLPVKSFDFNQANILGLTDGTAGAFKEVDVEAGTSSPSVAGKSYWLGSMSNSSSFNNKPNRNRIFAINTTGTGAATTFSNGGSYSNLRQQLITWGDANGYNFTASAADGKDPKVIDGFNLEGMVFGPDNTTIYLGFRAPLVPTANRTKAVIAPIQNFETWFNNGSPAGNAVIGAPIELNLGGRGIRDIIRCTNGVYVIIAGSYGGASVPAVYTWTGIATDSPILTDFAVNGLNVEGVLQVNEGGVMNPTKLQVLSDDGDQVYYNDGIAAKDLTQDNYKKFNSDIILSSATVPVQFVYFNAGIQNNTVLLNWQVGQTDEVRNFEILRSTNGRDFISIATVQSVIARSIYSFTDNIILNGKVYYRIKAIEKTSREYLSTVRIIAINANVENVLLYPNPVTDKFVTVVVNTPGLKNIQVYSATGALYRSLSFTDNVKDINTELWSKGSYFMRITLSDGTSSIKKLIIQ